MQELLTFMIGESWYALEVQYVREVAKYETLTPIPDMPSHCLGLVNLRGQIITVVNPASFIKVQSFQSPEQGQIIILKSREDMARSVRASSATDAVGRDPLGIKVDAVGDVLDMSNWQETPLPDNLSAVEKDFFKGIYQLDGEVLMVLSIEALIRVSHCSTVSE